VAFAEHGARVVIASRRAAESEETLHLVRAAGSDGLFVATDVTREADLAALITRIDTEYGRLDFAFNNAGTLGELMPVTEQTEENFLHVMTTNVQGVLLGMKHQIRYMLAHGGGAIVNNASVYGLRAFPTGAAYVASKHAVLGLTRAAALEVARSGIRVNAVLPAVTFTEMSERVRLEAGLSPEDSAAGHPIGRVAQPAEIASAVIYLCSVGAGFVTGHSLVLDGGMMA
jgi:NAD(P)-dependent dehydrogenase (short-subunit alcohol dehydrogenase family)